MANNKEDIIRRLKEIRHLLNLKSGVFAQKSGIDPRNYSSIETGKRTIGERVMRDICNTYNINPVWLRTGEGEIFLQLNDITTNLPIQTDNDHNQNSIDMNTDKLIAVIGIAERDDSAER